VIGRLLGLAALSTLIASTAWAGVPAGKLMVAKGHVTLNGHAASRGAVLKAGDRLETGHESKADVSLADGSALRLNPDTSLTLTSLGDRIRLTLAHGGVINVVHHGSDYQMLTPGAVAAVRGTVFYMESDGTPSKTYICDCEGSVEMINRKNQVSELHANGHHDGVWIGGEKSAPAPMHGHHDEDTAELERLRH
jgi:hypothetical protein